MRKIILLLISCILVFSGCIGKHSNITKTVENNEENIEVQNRKIATNTLEYGYNRDQTNNWYMSGRTPSNTNYSAINFDVNEDIKYESLDETGSICALVNNTLFISKGKKLYSINLTNKKANWKYELDVHIKKVMIKSDIIFIQTRNKIYALKDMGTDYEVLWKKKGQELIVDMTFDDVYTYYLKSSRELLAVDSYTGEVKWSFKVPKDNNIFSRKLITGDNKIFFTSDNIESNSYQLYSLENKTGKILWYQNLEKINYPSSKVPVYIDGRIFIDFNLVVYPKLESSKIKAFNSETGKLLWEHKIQGSLDSKKNSSSLVANKKYLVFTDTENNMHSLNIENGIKSWEIPLGNDTAFLPIITNDMIFINVDRNVKAFGITNGRFLKEFGVSQEYIYPFIINSEKFIAASESNIYSFNILNRKK